MTTGIRSNLAHPTGIMGSIGGVIGVKGNPTGLCCCGGGIGDGPPCGHCVFNETQLSNYYITQYHPVVPTPSRPEGWPYPPAPIDDAEFFYGLWQLGAGQCYWAGTSANSGWTGYSGYPDPLPVILVWGRSPAPYDSDLSSTPLAWYPAWQIWGRSLYSAGPPVVEHWRPLWVGPSDTCNAEGLYTASSMGFGFPTVSVNPLILARP